MKSRYLIFFSLLIIAFSSCRKEESEWIVEAPARNVKLEILNDTIFYYPSVIRSFHNHRSKDEGNEYYNVIRYRLTNNSDKKYLLFIKDIDLVQITGFRIFFKKENREIVLGNSALITPLDYDRCDVCKTEEEIAYTDKARKIQKNIKGEFHRVYMNQTQIIFPGESWEFSALLPLPNVISERDYAFYYDFNEDAQYKFFIEYRVSETYLNAEFPKDYLKQLENNDVEIFKGKLVSNEIEVIPIK